MNSEEIRKKFLEFFEKRGHAVIPSASLIPENDPTTLFTGSGMQPMIPFLLGAKHPKGVRVANSQKSFRASDIEEVGDNRHTTFFEMLGNWSLGDYFKKEQLSWLFEFLIDEIGLDPQKLYVMVFIGDKKYEFPKDDESVVVWKELFAKKGINAKDVEIGSETDGYEKGMQGGRIFYYDTSKNWWSRAGTPENMPVGEPGGPDSEVFYNFGISHDPRYGKECHPNCDCGRFLEIGNSVFMEYSKKTENSFVSLVQKNVDFGGGLERIAMAANDTSDMFKINHEPIIEYLEKISSKKYGVNEQETKAFRVIADHMKATVFLIADGVTPSNIDRGYFVRRLIRRSVRYADQLVINKSSLTELVESIAGMYKDSYPEVGNNISKIKETIQAEEEKFRKTLEKGLKEFNWRIKHHESDKSAKDELPPSIVFGLVTTYGFPFELVEEVARERGMTVNKMQFQNRMDAHRLKSRAGVEQKFKGGLADTSEQTIKYHTATHLLHQALHDVLGDEVGQKGSNLTTERLRFDFSFPRKLTDEEKQKVEEIVNQKISENLPVHKIILTKEEAVKTGARHFFDQKYPDEISVYYIGDNLENAYSKEFCGGPHVENIGMLGKFKIIKEEAVSAGVRRIKAVLE